MHYVLDKDCPVWQKHNPLCGGKCWHYCQIIPDKEKELEEKNKNQKKQITKAYEEINELKDKLTQLLEKNKKIEEVKDDLEKQLKDTQKEKKKLLAEVGKLSVEIDNKGAELTKKDIELQNINKETKRIKENTPITFEAWVEKQSKIIPLNKKWELIHDDFSGSVGSQKQKKWESKGFSYEDVSFLIKVIGLKAVEYDLAEWIRDSKKINLTDLPNEKLSDLKEEFTIAKSQNKVIFTLYKKFDNTDITRRFGYFLFEGSEWKKWVHKGEKNFLEQNYKHEVNRKIELKLNEKASIIKPDDIKYLLLNNPSKKVLISSFETFEFNWIGHNRENRQIVINEPFSISIYENND